MSCINGGDAGVLPNRFGLFWLDSGGPEALAVSVWPYNSGPALFCDESDDFDPQDWDGTSLEDLDPNQIREWRFRDRWKPDLPAR